MTDHGCRKHSIIKIGQLHGDALAGDYENDRTNAQFVFSTKVEQGCGFPSTLFSLIDLTILTDVSSGVEKGGGINYGFDGSKSLLRRL